MESPSDVGDMVNLGVQKTIRPISSILHLRRIPACPTYQDNGSGLNYHNLEVAKNTNSHRFSKKYLRSRIFCEKHNFQELFFINMPSCINYIIGNWCKQRSTLWATMHGRSYTPGTSYDEWLDSAAKAIMSSGSGQERFI